MINYHDLEPQKYWSPPASWSIEKKKETTKNRIFSNEWLGARKMDGAFYKFVKDDKGNMELLGRTKGVNGDYLNKIEWVPQLNDFFDSIPNNSCLLGELYFPNKEGSRHVTTITGCLKEKAIDRQKENKLHYYVFDILALSGENIINYAAEQRFEVLKNFSNGRNFKYVEFAKYLKGKELWDELQNILTSGGEGIVMTRGTSKYQPSKRPSKDCQKVKKELTDTIDCFFTGKATSPTRLYSGKNIQEWEYWVNHKNDLLEIKSHFKDYSDGLPIEPVTKPYYYGWAGSLEIGVMDGNKIKSIGYISGLTDEIKEHWKDYRHKCIEVGAMQIEGDQYNPTLRHGKMLGFRDDLTINDCTLEKIVGR